MKICSLLPSATEIVYCLGLGDRLTGVTHECDYPPQASQITVVTRSAFDSDELNSAEIHNHISRSLHSGSSIYHLDHDLLERTAPDLILTQELCDVCAVSYGEVRRAVRSTSVDRKVLSLEPTGLDDILETIRMVAVETGFPERGQAFTAGLQERIDSVIAKASKVDSRPRVLTLEWLDPLLVGGHWVPEMIAAAGGQDVLGRAGERSFQVSWEEVAASDPDRILLMPCGFDLARTIAESRQLDRPEWRSLTAVGEEGVYAVDGSAYFNRPGPRIVDGLEIVAEILHPDRFSKKSPPDAWQRVVQQTKT